MTTSFWSRECSLEAGLPDPELGSALYDAAGRWIGFFDLTWRAARLIAEYDGDQHRTSTKQYELDIRRFDDAAQAGYRVIRVRAHGLVRTRAETARLLGDAYSASGAAPPLAALTPNGRKST